MSVYLIHLCKKDLHCLDHLRKLAGAHRTKASLKKEWKKIRQWLLQEGQTKVTYVLMYYYFAQILRYTVTVKKEPQQKLIR